MKRIVLKPGMLFGVPLRDQGYIPGIVTHKGKYSGFAAFGQTLMPVDCSTEMIERAIACAPWFRAYIAGIGFTRHHWKLFARNVQIPSPLVRLPLFRVCSDEPPTMYLGGLDFYPVFVEEPSDGEEVLNYVGYGYAALMQTLEEFAAVPKDEVEEWKRREGIIS
ncbi:MAG: hypothetical protein J0L72_10340 [Armatimonadetes bacterium]|nr:hypothetical protein [Armatimonadota bacterium]